MRRRERRPARTGRAAAIAALAAALGTGCWVEEIHIEPDGWSADGDGRDGDAGGPVCGDGVVEGSEECDGDPPRDCTTPCGEAGTQACVACVWETACAAGPVPVNDGCDGALDIGAGGLFAGSTCSATDDHEPAPACAGAGAPDVWFTFTLERPEVVYLDTVDGETWDSVLQIRRGGCAAASAPVVCGNDACPDVAGGRRSQLVATLDAGTYHVVVDGNGPAAAGSFALLFQRAPCAESTWMTGNGNYVGDTAGSTDGFVGSCGGATGPDVLYHFGLCGPRTVTATTCNPGAGFDSVLAFATGGCDGTHEVTCNDDDPGCGFGAGRSTVTADLPQGLNFLIVDGRRSAGGPFQVTISGI